VKDSVHDYRRVIQTNSDVLWTHQLFSCYELKLKGLSNRTTLVLSNTRELDKVPSTE